MSALDSAKVIRYGNTLPKWTADTSKISPQNPIIHRANPILQLAQVYAFGAAERSPVLPNVPTSEEAGLAEFQASSWWALFAPKGTPQAILDKLTDALDKTLDDPDVRKRFFDLGGDIPGKPQRGQKPLAALVKSEIARWTPIIKAANAKTQ